MRRFLLATFLLCAPVAARANPALDLWLAGQPAPDPVPDVAAGYHFARPTLDALAAAAAARPGVVTVEEIGRTAGKQPIFAFHVQRPGAPVTRRVLVLAGIHALEWISTEVATAFLEEAIADPPAGVALTVIPIFNVDGRRKVEADLLAGRDAYRRGNGANVDLNRDFAVNREPVAFWRHLIPGRYATSPDALSQPETRALDALAAREGFDRAVSLHAFGGYLYFPWSGRYARPDDWKDFEALGRQMEAAQAVHAYRTAELSRWGFFFRAQGSELDHLYGQYGVKSFLIELTRSGLRPWKPADFHTPFRYYNPVDPAPHVARGVAAVRAFVRAADPQRLDAGGDGA